MATKELSAQERTKLSHVKKPLALLASWGCSPEDAIETLWTESAALALPLNHEIVAALMDTIEESTLEHHIALLQQLLDSDRDPHYFEHQRSEKRTALLAHFIARDLDIVLAHLHQIPAPFDGYVVLHLLDQERLETIPESALTSIVRWWYWDGWELRNLIGRLGDIKARIEPAQWREACLEVAQTIGVSSPRLFPWEVLDDADEATLIAIGLQLFQPERALTSRISSYGTGLLPQLEEAVLGLEQAETGHITKGAALLPAYAACLHLAGRPLPDVIVRWLDHALSRYHYEETYDLPALLNLIPEARVIEQVEEHLESNEWLQRTFGALHAGTCIRPVIDQLRENRLRKWLQERYIEGFASGGERAAAVISEALADDLPSHVVALLAEALGNIEGPTSTAALLSLLHHSSKVVREHARNGLATRGDEALQGLENAILAKKKTTRAAAIEVLKSLPASAPRENFIADMQAQTQDKTVQAALQTLQDTEVAEEGPLQQVLAFAANISEAKRDEIKGLVDTWYSFQEDEIPPLFDRTGMSALLCPNIHDNCLAMDLWREAAAHFKNEPLAPWLVVYHTSQVPKMKRSWAMRELNGCFDALEDRTLLPLSALAMSGNNQAFLLNRLTAIDPTAGVARYAEALHASSKGTREAGQKGLLAVGAAATPSVTPALSATKKPTRLAAAQVLKQLKDAAAIEALEAAFATEKNAEVAAALQDAIHACSDTAPITANASSREALEVFLRETQAIRLPKFVSLDALPPLRWKTGEPLADDLKAGWIYQLALETPDAPNAHARELREELDPDDCHKLGLSLYTLWQDNKKPTKYRWLKWQMSCSGSLAWLYDFAFWPARDEYPIIGNHGTRLGALLLIAFAPPRSKRKANELHTEAIERISPALFPSDEETRAFHAEQGDQRLNAYQFSPDGTKHDATDEGYEVSWQIRPTTPPALGEITSSLTLDLIHFALDEGVDSHRAPQLLRQAQAQQARLQKELDKEVTALHQRITPETRELRWSVPGWHRLFALHPLWRLCGQGLLFQSETGLRFLCGPEGQPLRADGELLSLDSRGFVYMRAVDDLAPEERSRFATTLAQQQTQVTYEIDLKTQVDTDPLQELRALLYSEPTPENWRAVCTLLEGWPGDDRELALSYVEAHVEESWGNNPRPAPENWALSLLDITNKRRISRSKSGENTDDDRRSCIRTCDHISFLHTLLRVADVKALIASPYLGHIRSLSWHGGRWYKGADKRLTTDLSLPSLRRFSLYETTLLKAAWEGLLRADWMQHLTHLSLRECDIEWQMLQRFIDAGILDNLESLDLRGNPLALPGVQLLVDYKKLRGLKELKLDYSFIEAEGMRYLVEESRFEALESLHLTAKRSWYEPNDEGAEMLASCDRFPQLKRLSLHKDWGEEDDDDVFDIGGGWLNIVLASKHLPSAAIDALRAQQNIEEAEGPTQLSDFR